MTKSLKQRAVHSGKWVIFGHVFSQLLRLSSNLILTRLLAPEMFGVMAIVSVIMAGLAMFSDVGLQQNIVQSKRGDEQVYLNTAWTIQIIRGFIIFFIALTFSWLLYAVGRTGVLPIDSVYGNTELPFILATVSVTAVISSFNSIQILLLNRKLMMDKLIKLEIISQITGLALMLIWAWFQRDIWALVFGGIVGALVKMILSHNPVLGERCKFEWDKDAVHEIFHFGKWIFISSIFGFMLLQGDRLLLGAWVTPEVLGIYSIAFFLSMALKDALKKVIGNVFYPMLSEVARTRPNDMKTVYYKIRAKVDILTMFFAGIMASVGHVFVDILYDERYQDAGWMFEILSLSMLFVGYSMAGTCLMAMGNSKSQTWLIFIAMLFLYVSLPLAYHFYGINGVIWMFAFNYAIDVPSTFYMLNKNKLLDMSKEFRMLPVFFISYGIGKYLLTFG